MCLRSDEKEPQLIVNRVVSIADLAEGPAAASERSAAQGRHTLYLRIGHADAPEGRKVLPILKMFPGSAKAVVYFADTGARLGGRCALDDRMLAELTSLLGEKNVVIR